MVRFTHNLILIMAVATISFLPGCSSTETRSECQESHETFIRKLELRAIEQLEADIKDSDLIPVIGQINIEYIYEYSWDAENLTDHPPSFYFVGPGNNQNSESKKLSVISGRPFLLTLLPGSYIIEVMKNPSIQTSAPTLMASVSFQVDKGYKTINIGVLNMKLNYQHEFLGAVVEDESSNVRKVIASLLPSFKNNIRDNFMKKIDTPSSVSVTDHKNNASIAIENDYLGNALAMIDKTYQERMANCDPYERYSSDDGSSADSDIASGAGWLLICVLGSVIASSGGYGVWLCGE